MKRTSRYAKMLALTLSLVLILSACSGNGGANSTNTGANVAGGGQAAEGGDLTYALATSPDSLDPHKSGLAVASRVYRGDIRQFGCKAAGQYD